MQHSDAAIIATLAYSDIFDYPLTKAQLWRYLTLDENSSLYMSEFEKALQKLLAEKKIGMYEEEYFLYRRKNLVLEKQKRKNISAKKILFAKKVCALLFLIPTISFIGLSGSLAMENAEKNADIDIFLIVKKDTIWMTRLLVLLLLQIKQIRRKRNSKKTRDTICVNMLIDTAHMSFPKKRQNLYTAHEIMQMKPFFSRGFTYERFLQHNSWIAKMLPHAFPTSSLKKFKKTKEKNSSSWFQIFEHPAKIIQLLYMKSHRSTETITHGFVAFHPEDYTGSILTLWQEKKQKYV